MDDKSAKAGQLGLVPKLSAQIVAAYVSNNPLPVDKISKLIRDVHATLASLSHEPTAVDLLQPAVPISESVTDEFIVCLEDGKKFKSLKRHLSSQYDMTPETYRDRWGLPLDYPMVAPSYARKRSELAKEMGLGRGIK